MEPIRVVWWKQTCDFCPSQWEARTDDGQAVYVRYRGGRLQVGLGADTHDAVAAAMSDTTSVLTLEGLGDMWDGFLTFDELVVYTEGVIDWEAE